MKALRVQWSLPPQEFDSILETESDVWSQLRALQSQATPAVVHLWGDVGGEVEGSLRLFICSDGFTAHYEYDLDPPYFVSAGEYTGGELLFRDGDQLLPEHRDRLLSPTKLGPLVNEFLASPNQLPGAIEWDEV